MLDDYEVPVVVEGDVEVAEVLLDFVAGLLVGFGVESTDLGDKGLHGVYFDLWVLWLACEFLVDNGFSAKR